MKALITLFAAIAFGIAPFVTEGFAGFRPDQFPIPQDNAPIQPSGYAFSIWSVIYLWLLVYAVVGVWQHRDDPGWDGTWIPMAISMGVGAIWIKVATLSVLWATGLIWVMCLTAVYAVFRASEGGPNWALSLPLGLYAGWLSAASFVALGLSGAGYGIAGDATFWGWIMLICALGFTTMNQVTFRGVWTYGLAVGWAFIAIGIKSSTEIFGWAAFAGAVVVLALTLGQLRRGV